MTTAARSLNDPLADFHWNNDQHANALAMKGWAYRPLASEISQECEANHNAIIEVRFQLSDLRTAMHQIIASRDNQLDYARYAPCREAAGLLSALIGRMKKQQKELEARLAMLRAKDEQMLLQWCNKHGIDRRTLR